MNFMCHVTLKNLRSKLESEEQDSKVAELKLKSKRGIPYVLFIILDLKLKGWGFGLVTCANYWWETCVWIAFAILVRCWTCTALFYS
jgi:very-long-chain enoyl-CoA reductase